ncbi:MAG: hypothetical protein WCH39_01345 [Schlesneria sp.]
MTMNRTSGRLLIPRSRRLTLDVLHYHKQSATCAHDRIFDLKRVAELRSRLTTRISWSILFIKAFGIVAAHRPVLRQSFQRWPWAHLYQHSQNVAMLATHRVHANEPWVLWSRFVQPEQQSLPSLQARLDRYLTEPIPQAFRQQWQLSGLPTFFRRILWWWTLNVSLSKRSHRAGTFFLTTLAGKGVEIQDPPAFLTSNLTYGPLDEQSRCRVTLSYDHRLMDGSFVADCLIELEHVLNNTIAAELEAIISGDETTATHPEKSS